MRRRLHRWVLRALGIWSPSLTLTMGRVVTKYGDPVKTDSEIAHITAGVGQQIMGEVEGLQKGLRDAASK